jgi:hypothetical protein
VVDGEIVILAVVAPPGDQLYVAPTIPEAVKVTAVPAQTVVPGFAFTVN